MGPGPLAMNSAGNLFFLAGPSGPNIPAGNGVANSCENRIDTISIGGPGPGPGPGQALVIRSYNDENCRMLNGGVDILDYSSWDPTSAPSPMVTPIIRHVFNGDFRAKAIHVPVSLSLGEVLFAASDSGSNGMVHLLQAGDVAGSGIALPLLTTNHNISSMLAVPSGPALPTATPPSTSTPTVTPTFTRTPTPLPTGTSTPSPTMTFTTTPAWKSSGLGKSVVGPVPANKNTPICLFFDRQPDNVTWEVFNIRGERIASMDYTTEIDQCWSHPGVAPGLYLAKIRVLNKDGTVEERTQQIILVE